MVQKPWLGNSEKDCHSPLRFMQGRIQADAIDANATVRNNTFCENTRLIVHKF